MPAKMTRPLLFFALCVSVVRGTGGVASDMMFGDRSASAPSHRAVAARITAPLADATPSELMFGRPAVPPAMPHAADRAATSLLGEACESMVLCVEVLPATAPYGSCPWGHGDTHDAGTRPPAPHPPAPVLTTAPAALAAACRSPTLPPATAFPFQRRLLPESPPLAVVRPRAPPLPAPQPPSSPRRPPRAARRS